VVAVVSTGCGSDASDITWTPLVGAPPVTRSLVIDHAGQPILFGSTSFNGEYYAVHQEGDLWVRAPGVPAAGLPDDR